MGAGQQQHGVSRLLHDPGNAQHPQCTLLTPYGHCMSQGKLTQVHGVLCKHRSLAGVFFCLFLVCHYAFLWTS